MTSRTMQVGDQSTQARPLADVLGVSHINGTYAFTESDCLNAGDDDATAWQAAHGYENQWWWPDLDATLSKIESPEVNAVQATLMNLFEEPKLQPGQTAFEHVAHALRMAESATPRLRAALRTALRNSTPGMPAAGDTMHGREWFYGEQAMEAK